MKTIKRQAYLDWLLAQRDKQIIKVVSGIRRSGKSTLLQLYKDLLKDDGVEASQIISLNFEELEFEHLQEYHSLYDFISRRLHKEKTTYIFLDEIQLVDNFEKVVDSLFVKPHADVYITGSNAKFLSSELASLLTGRYVELKIFPLSFKEYCEGDHENLDQKFETYIDRGSFPFTISTSASRESSIEYLRDLYDAILLKDVLFRNNISDISALKNVADFLLHSIGSPINPTNIANTLTSNGKKIDVKTVDKYIQALTASMLLYKVKRFNIKGKQFLGTNAKYYSVDLGMRRLRVGGRDSDIGHILENIVFLELSRRFTKVYFGELANTEIDFVVETDGGYHYFQVAASMLDSNTAKRELSPFAKINDNYPKTVLTMDKLFANTTTNGVENRNIIEWLLS